MEHFLSQKNELFDFQGIIYLFDNTNIYFEGQKDKFSTADFGLSKKKRSDLKLVVFAAVVNLEGFFKYSNIFKGDKVDCKTLSDMIENLKKYSS